MLSNELVLTVSGPGDRPVPGCRLALYEQQEKPTHMNQAGEAASTRGGLFPCGLAAGNKSHAVPAAQSQRMEQAK